jgi:hypothetical protein
MDVNTGGPRGYSPGRNDHRQGSYNDNGNNSNEYCQPLSSQDGQGSNNFNVRQGQQQQEKTPDESARSNAVFKQQVATMAMNEASTAFKDMEDAFAQAKEILAQCRAMSTPSSPTLPEDDPMVVEANARAKKCQSVAMFKLKVSQRASEEAANAYDAYQRMVEGNAAGGGRGGGGSGGMGMMGGMGGGRGMMGGMGGGGEGMMGRMNDSY